MIKYISELIKKKPSLKKKYKKIIQNHPNIFSTYKTWGLASKDWKTTVPKLIDKVYDQLINHEYNVTYKRLQQLRNNGDILASILENDIKEYNEKKFGKATKKKKPTKKKTTKRKATRKKTRSKRNSMFYVSKGDKVKLMQQWVTKKMGRGEWDDLPLITLSPGLKGEVTYVGIQGEFHVLWDNGIETIEMADVSIMEVIKKVRSTKKNPKKFRYKVNRPQGQGRHIMNPPLSPKTKETIFGWGKRKPILQSERRTVAKKYGRGCFLDKRGLRFPVCGKTGHIDCDGLKSAYARARQFGHKAWADRALRLAKRHECDWVQRHRNPIRKSTTDRGIGRVGRRRMRPTRR